MSFLFSLPLNAKKQEQNPKTHQNTNKDLLLTTDQDSPQATVPLALWLPGPPLILKCAKLCFTFVFPWMFVLSKPVAPSTLPLADFYSPLTFQIHVPEGHFLVSIRSLSAHPPYRTFSPPQKEMPYPSTSYSRSWQPPVYILSLNVSFKWDHMTCGLLWLASFTWRDVFWFIQVVACISP